MVDDDFDWGGVAAEGGKIVNQARETVVYLNPDNDVVIRQRKNWPDEQEDPFLVIPLYRVRALIDRLDALLLEAHEQKGGEVPTSR
jgi:hypothetical protein